MELESLSKRIAKVVVASNQVKESKRKAQLEEMEKQMPEKDPKIKMLDSLYEALSDQDCAGALDLLYKLTNDLDLGEEVSFDVPESEEEEDKHHSAPHEEKPMDVHSHEPEDHSVDTNVED